MKKPYEDIITAENVTTDIETDQAALSKIESDSKLMRDALKQNPIGKQNWSISEIFQKYKRSELILDPSYQRRGNMWEKSKKIEFIESLLLGIFIPPIYVVENIVKNEFGLVQHEYEVVDGKQRISAIIEFIDGDPESSIKNQLVLSKASLKYFSDYYGDKTIRDIAEIDENESFSFLDDFYSHGIDIYVIKASMPEELRYDIFARLNQGVSKLSADELRRAIYRTELVEFIEEFIKEKLDNDPVYSEVFTENDIKRYKDLGRFFRSIGFYYSSDIGTKSILNYNSRPKDMINNILERFKKKAENHIPFDKEKIKDILDETYNHYSVKLKNNPESDYILDASIKLLVDKLITIDEVITISETNDFKKSLETSKSTTTNVNMRFQLFCDKDLKDRSNE